MSRNAVQLFQDAKGLSLRWMEQAIPKSISTDGDHMYSYNDVTIGAKEKSYQNQCRKLRKSIKKIIQPKNAFAIFQPEDFQGRRL